MSLQSKPIPATKGNGTASPVKENALDVMFGPRKLIPTKARKLEVKFDPSRMEYSRD